MKRALLVIDLQNDFLPGGTLAVPQGDQIIPKIQALLDSDQFDLRIATQDWHPAGHQSFASSHPGKTPFQEVDLQGIPQTLWPDHCIQDTPGAAFAPGIDPETFDTIIQKGTHPEIDSYSGFFDNARKHQTALHTYLKENDVEHLTIAGLATDYCVKFTVLDALELGYQTTLITGACRSINQSGMVIEDVLAEITAAGGNLIAPENSRNKRDQFKPGFRFSFFDLTILLTGLLGTVAASIQAWWAGLIIAFVILHFFLFCNLFRISRPPELIWAASFLILAGTTIVSGKPGWIPTFLLSALLSSFLIWKETKTPSYHGIAWQHWNPQLETWWESQKIKTP